MDKLNKLAEIEGMSIEDLCSHATFDGVAKGICSNPDCDYTCEVEPDQKEGYCEVCKTCTVTSAAVLAGII